MTLLARVQERIVVPLTRWYTASGICMSWQSDKSNVLVSFASSHLWITLTRGCIKFPSPVIKSVREEYQVWKRGRLCCR